MIICEKNKHWEEGHHTHKRCNQCEEAKLPEDFSYSTNKFEKRIKKGKCKSCSNINLTAYRFGITREEVLELLKATNCEICDI